MRIKRNKKKRHTGSYATKKEPQSRNITHNQQQKK